MGIPEPGPPERMDWLLRLLFSDFGVVPFRAGVIFHGRASRYCVEHRSEVEQGLRQLPGAFCFERIGEATYLTYTVPGPQVKPVNWPLHAALFLATILTTLYVGGAAFSISILLIIGCHESGHYFMARRYGMLVTPPYFLPMPYGPIGTFGAVIRIRSPILHRRALLDVGMAGPFAGLLVAVPILIYGLSHSALVPLAVLGERVGVVFGNSLLTWGLERLVFGHVPQGMAVNWLGNPYAWAGWVGLLVAALNLMPVGQLDGGHIAYVVLGRWQRRLAQLMLVLLLALDLSALIVLHQVNWVLWCLLMVFVFKLRHPPVILEDVPVGPGRRALGWLALAIFVLVFMPLPVILPS